MAGPITKRSKASRFPAARIKKIMQMDEEVGKLSSATPVMISKSLECFMQLLLDEATKEMRSKGSKKLTAYHLKRTVNNTPNFDFLLETVSRVSDPIGGEGAEGSGAAGPSRRKPSSSGAPKAEGAKGRKRKATAAAQAVEEDPDAEAEELKPYADALGNAGAGGSRGGARGDEEVEMEMEYSGRRTVRPGLGDLLNPAEEDVKPTMAVASVAGGSGSGVAAGTEERAAQAGQAGQNEGGGMFDDYDDDDDY